MADYQPPSGIEALRAAQQAAGGDIEDAVFDEQNNTNVEEAITEQRTAHHIRANSSILHLKKLLGMCQMR